MSELLGDIICKINKNKNLWFFDLAKDFEMLFEYIPQFIKQKVVAIIRDENLDMTECSYKLKTLLNMIRSWEDNKAEHYKVVSTKRVRIM